MGITLNRPEQEESKRGNPLFSIANLIMRFPSSGRINSNGNFDRRYATGWGRTSRQQSADFMRSLSPRRFRSNFWL